MNPLANLKAVKTLTLDASSSNIATNAYTQLVSAANMTKAASYVEIFNSTGATLILAQGEAASEVALDYTILLGGSSQLVPLNLLNGKRLSVKALDTASVIGILVLNLFG